MSQSLVLVAGESPQHLLQVVGLQEGYQHFLCKKKVFLVWYGSPISIAVSAGKMQ